MNTTYIIYHVSASVVVEISIFKQMEQYEKYDLLEWYNGTGLYVHI